ncbi:phage N-6-adenine-methyltransferase [Adlercreutzia muris]|uniref:phage N-6-adenine-methyltransferase n=1 Tax=Adlercreutzia muris TaxID=1796610 RepID=UPI003518CC19
MSGMCGSGGVAYSSERHDWETPQDFFDALNDEFGFDLDAAASAENAKCREFFDEEADGLSSDWGGRTVWCNPPYGRQIGRWVAKAAAEARKPGTTVVLLVPARTDTRWFHDHLYGKAELRFVRGRLRFGGSDWNAPFPSMVAVLGERKEER